MEEGHAGDGGPELRRGHLGQWDCGQGSAREVTEEQACWSLSVLLQYDHL